MSDSKCASQVRNPPATTRGPERTTVVLESPTLTNFVGGACSPDSAVCRSQELCSATERRGRQHPVVAHDAAVVAARRLRCAARSRGPSQKLASLTSFATLRQSATSQPLMRAARAGPDPWPCRPRQALGLGRSPGTSGPLDRSCPGSPTRRRINRPNQAPTAAWTRSGIRRRAPFRRRGRWVAV